MITLEGNCQCTGGEKAGVATQKIRLRLGKKLRVIIRTAHSASFFSVMPPALW